MKKYERIKDLYDDMDNIKREVRKMDKHQLRIYKDCFYSLRLKEWQLDLIWEYIWDDLKKYEVTLILLRANMIQVI